MEDYHNNFDYQNRLFQTAGVNIKKPGFYDDKNFLQLEQHNSELLNNYASFVKQNIYDATYLKNSELKISEIVKTLYDQLRKDGRLGACIDMAGAFSRMLDQEGIWNYVVNGSLTVTFPKHTNLDKKYFWTIDFGQFTMAHAWIVAPPFKVVDVTLKSQPYNAKELAYLPDYLLQKAMDVEKLKLDDLIEPNIYQALQVTYLNNDQTIMDKVFPTLSLFSSFFKPESCMVKGTRFKYTPIGIAATDTDLENCVALNLNGMSGHEIYVKLIQPKLQELTKPD